ncbi:MAG TPA: hypothetical protein VE057_01885 [Archangium sp.]|nr:hypothetical protein [Archangium sp.]
MHLFKLLNHSLGTSLRTTTRLALATGAMLGLFAQPAFASDANCIVGSWEGTIKEKDNTTGQLRINPVVLDITSLEKDTDKGRAGVLRFPPPRACRLALSYSGENENQYYLTMGEPNGGLCARLLNVQLRLECVGPTMSRCNASSTASSARSFRVWRAGSPGPPPQADAVGKQKPGNGETLPPLPPLPAGDEAPISS